FRRGFDFEVDLGRLTLHWPVGVDEKCKATRRQNHQTDDAAYNLQNRFHEFLLRIEREVSERNETSRRPARISPGRAWTSPRNAPIHNLGRAPGSCQPRAACASSLVC